MKEEIPYQKEIESLLSEIFRKDWMDEDDLDEVIREILSKSGTSIKDISDSLIIGLNNGYSLKTQFNLIRLFFTN